MKYKELLLRFMVGENVGIYNLEKLLKAGYIKQDTDLKKIGIDAWLRPQQEHFEITELGLKKLGGGDENHT